MNCSEIGLLIYGLFNDAISGCDYTSQHCLGGLRKTMTILSHYRRLRDENWTWVLPTTQHEYQLFRLELEMMEDKNVHIVVTERLST
jgi:hypothetical protein